MRSVIALLAMAVVVSSLTLVYVRHQNRVKFVQLRDLQTQRDELEIDWRELLIESRSVSKHHRVDQDAFEMLGMQLPEPDNTIIVDMRTRGDRAPQNRVSVK